jgi:hypothetical protein
MIVILLLQNGEPGRSVGHLGTEGSVEGGTGVLLQKIDIPRTRPN